MKTIEEMASEVGGQRGGMAELNIPAPVWVLDDQEIKAFAALVAQQENEACAKACEDADLFDYYDPGGSYAAVIRARSTSAPADAPTPTDPPPG